MTSKPLFALAASLLAIGAATAGAAQSSNTRAISQGSSTKAAQQHPQIVQEFGGEEGGARGAYVRQVGAKVAARTNIQGGANAFRITTLNSPVMNAFAVPGGYLYITRQLLGLMNDEAELASVLGHEAGHIAARHSSERQRAGILSQILSVGAALVTGSGQLGQLAGQLGQGLFLSYSRKQELEADDLGVRYIAGAGYDPNASATFLASLGAATSLESRAAGRNDERSTPSWARTHPLSAERVRRATQTAQKTGVVGRGLRNRDQFLAQVDGLMVDDDPKQGVIEGRTFVHPDLRLRFSVPTGYGMQNGARAVSIVGQSGQAQFSTLPYNGNLSAYVSQVFQALGGQQARIPHPAPQGTTINGLQAAYSSTRVQAQQGVVDVTVVAYQFDASHAYHFAMITRAGTGIGPFQSMVSSLRRIGAQQAAAIRPRVLQIHTVRAGETVASLAGRMAYTSYQQERFKVLNGLAANAVLRPGDRVKLVVYGARSG
jgi:predicted Zn-dependent protease